MEVDYSRVQTKKMLFERFPDGNIPRYWRMGELKEILGYANVSSVRDFCRKYEIPYYRYSGKMQIEEKTKQAIVLREDVRGKLLDKKVAWKLLKGRRAGLAMEFLSLYTVKYPELLAKKIEELDTSEGRQHFVHTLALERESAALAAHVKDMLEKLVEKRTRRYRTSVVPHEIDKLYSEIFVQRDEFREAVHNNEGLREVIELVRIYKETFEANFEAIFDMCKRIDLELDPQD